MNYEGKLAPPSVCETLYIVIKQKARNNFCISGDIYVTWMKTVLKHDGAVDTHMYVGISLELTIFQGGTTGFRRHKNCLS